MPKEDASPSLIVNIRSIDSLMDDAKYIMTLAGQEELAKQLDGMLKSMVGKEGLKGIDTKRPLGFYGTVGKNLVTAPASRWCRWPMRRPSSNCSTA